MKNELEEFDQEISQEDPWRKLDGIVDLCGIPLIIGAWILITIRFFIINFLK